MAFPNNEQEFRMSSNMDFRMVSFTAKRPKVIILEAILSVKPGLVETILPNARILWRIVTGFRHLEVTGMHRSHLLSCFPYLILRSLQSTSIQYFSDKNYRLSKLT